MTVDADKRRIEIRAWLEARGPAQLQAFDAAVMLLERKDLPGWPSMLGHSVREIRNALPKLAGAPLVERSRSDRDLEALVQHWDSVAPSGLGLGSAVSQLPDTIEVPSSLLEPIREALNRHRQEADNGRDQAEKLFRFLLPGSHPGDLGQVVHQWWRSTDFFMNLVHLNREGAVRRVDNAEVERQFELFEATLAGLVGHFYTTIDELDALLVAANGTSQPSCDLVDRVVARLARREHLTYFFDRLTTPHWLLPLAERQFFAHPPEPVEDERAAIVTTHRWPQSQYLLRMARDPDAADSVLDIVAALPVSSNPRVNADIVEAVVRLPPDHSLRLRQKVLKWAQPPHLEHRPELLGQLIVAWAERGHPKQAIEVFEQLFAAIVFPREPSSELSSVGDLVRFPFTGWEYAETLRETTQALTEHCPAELFRALGYMLAKAIDLGVRGERAKAAGADLSYIWHASVRPGSTALSTSDVRGALLTALAISARKLLEAREPFESVFEPLWSHRWHLHRRLALALVAERGDDELERARSLVLDRDLFKEVGVRHEYYRLLRRVFEDLTEFDRAGWFEWIDSGVGLNSVAEWARQCHGREPTSDECAAWLGTWQRDRLAPLAGLLPRRWSEHLRKLEAEYGAADRSDLPFHTTSFVGPNSPIDIEEVSEMSSAELAQYLRGWIPEGGRFEASPEGLGRVLRGAVEKRPETFSSDARHFRDLDPTYVRAFLGGLKDAVKVGATIDWTAVLELCEWTADQARETSIERHFVEGDSHWGWARRAAMDLVAAGMHARMDAKGGIPWSLRERTWGLIATVLEDPNPTPEEDRSSGMGPGTASINTVRGEAVHTMFHYLVWVGRESGLSGLNRMPEVLAGLERRLNPDVETSPAIRAAIGQWLPWLHEADPYWTTENATRLFALDQGDAALWGAARDSYLRMNKAYDSVLLDLMPVYSRWVDLLVDTNVDAEPSWGSPESKLGQHLAYAFGRGHLGLREDNPWVRFLSNAPPKIVRATLAWFGRSLQIGGPAPTKQLVDSLRQRAEDLWELVEKGPEDRYRVLCGALSEWVASTILDRGWLLDRLGLAVASASEVEVKPDAVLKFLAESIASQPEATLRTAILLLKRDEAGWLLYRNVEGIAEILAVGMANPAVRAETRQFIGWLGERGFHQFRGLLNGGST